MGAGVVGQSAGAWRVSMMDRRRRGPEHAKTSCPARADHTRWVLGCNVPLGYCDHMHDRGSQAAQHTPKSSLGAADHKGFGRRTLDPRHATAAAAVRQRPRSHGGQTRGVGGVDQAAICLSDFQDPDAPRLPPQCTQIRPSQACTQPWKRAVTGGGGGMLPRARRSSQGGGQNLRSSVTRCAPPQTAGAGWTLRR